MFKYLEGLFYKTNIAIFSCAVTYVIEKGTETVKNITNEDISNLKGNGLMTAEYCQAIVRTAKDIVKFLDTPTELIQFCNAIDLYETSFYTMGEYADRSTLEKAVRELVNSMFYGGAKFHNIDDLADYLDMEADELKNLMTR